MSAIAEEIKTHFPTMNHPDLIQAIEENATVMEVAAGTTIMDIGGYFKVMPLVTKGAIKVLREDDEGGELFLYFLNPGQSCAMTVQCCMAHAPSQVRAIAEDDTEFIGVPVRFMDEWIRKYSGWKDFILHTYSDRFTELLHTVDSVVFNNLDERLLEYLGEKSKISASSVINTTHQEIADDLHSSREVISRLLKQLEKHGKIKLSRNKIELV